MKPLVQGGGQGQALEPDHDQASGSGPEQRGQAGADQERDQQATDEQRSGQLDAGQRGRRQRDQHQAGHVQQAAQDGGAGAHRDRSLESVASQPDEGGVAARAGQHEAGAPGRERERQQRPAFGALDAQQQPVSPGSGHDEGERRDPGQHGQSGRDVRKRLQQVGGSDKPQHEEQQQAGDPDRDGRSDQSTSLTGKPTEGGHRSPELNR